MSQILESRWLICRICLKSENKKLYNIFETNSAEEIADLGGTTLQDKIELCGDVKLQQQNNLPNKICNRCVLLLRAAYKFRDLCQQSQNQLKQFIKTLDEKNNPEDNLDINFDSDAEEQQAEVQEESENILLTETDDFVVEESVVHYETEDNNEERNDIFIENIQEENEVMTEFSEEEDTSQYMVEEVDAKEFANEDNEDDITTIFRYEHDVIIEEHPKKTTEKLKIINERKPAVKRKRKQSQDDNGVYACGFCDNSYTEKSKYNNHLKYHIKKKPHECEICKKRFSTTPQLSRHMNSHTGKRPYKCQYCEASFGDPSTKIKHERIHTNERPYKCNVCDKAFAYSNVLKVHLMTHTGEKPHTCEYCGKSFSQLHHKNAHEKRHTNAQKLLVSNSPDIEFMDNEDDLSEYKIEEII